MNREQFVKWLKEESPYYNNNKHSDHHWQYDVEYEPLIRDDLYVSGDTVTLSWEKWYWGGVEHKSDDYSFEEFVERYNNDSLKNY